eukprot:TRINITY_DN43051_c0_g1_i1.p1 TRINITY_DN43051_c0_g1~~TRINITY_DN43051_c0_g1_i1.p1  ORF type:complete len:366 (-),score=80.52 TRINITY_DN43051_c0_g1_i1:116-1213(-)
MPFMRQDTDTLDDPDEQAADEDGHPEERDHSAAAAAGRDLWITVQPSSRPGTSNSRRDPLDPVSPTSPASPVSPSSVAVGPSGRRRSLPCISSLTPTSPAGVPSPSQRRFSVSTAGSSSWASRQISAGSTSSAGGEGLTPRQPSAGLPKTADDDVKFDYLTLTQWFFEIDEDKSGTISRKEFMNLVRKYPTLRELLINSKRPARRAPSKEEEEERAPDSPKPGAFNASKLKQLMRVWAQSDIDGNGELDWEEFVALFRETGHLLEYADKGNPRDQLAATLWEQRLEKTGLDRATRAKLHHITCSNLSGHQRKSICIPLESGGPVDPKPPAQDTRPTYMRPRMSAFGAFDDASASGALPGVWAFGK